MTPAEGIALSPMTAVLAAGVVAWLLIGEPLYGRASFRRFRAALARGEAGARGRLYAWWSAGAWVLALAVIALAAADPGFGLVRLGFRWPNFAAFGNFMTAMFLAALVTGLVAGVIGQFLGRNKARKAGEGEGEGGPNGGSEVPAAVTEQVLAMLPRTRGERWGFAGVSVTAGVTEEIVWRGFLVAVLVAALPAMPTAGYVVIGGALFGWAHLYQGLVGVVMTAIVGGALMFLYLATASLLLPIVLHAAIDLRALLIPVPRAAEAGDEARR